MLWSSLSREQIKVISRSNQKVEWIRKNPPSQEFETLATFLKDKWGEQHWSRLWEYPWILLNGGFKQGQQVLDAAGGDAKLQSLMAMLGCQVLNVDDDAEAHERAKVLYKDRPLFQNVRYLHADLHSFSSDVLCFDRIVCASVLEHTDQHIGLLRGLWSWLAPGGRLLVTMDVAGYSRKNHTINVEKAAEILSEFGAELPVFPEDLLTRRFDELEPNVIEPKQVELAVLCWSVDKD